MGVAPGGGSAFWFSRNSLLVVGSGCGSEGGPLIVRTTCR